MPEAEQNSVYLFVSHGGGQRVGEVGDRAADVHFQLPGLEPTWKQLPLPRRKIGDFSRLLHLLATCTCAQPAQFMK